MRIFHHINEWLSVRASLPSSQRLGFVPTMGNLHAGHASLFSASVAENNLTVASLFVNPTQFNQRADFTHYPRTLEADLEIMRQCGVDYCILPKEQEIYIDGYQYQIHEQQLSQLMEGVHRPGHFNGVLTVVMKLFQLTKPNCAYFGEKDYQQLLLIQGMVDAFFLGITLKACPTIREPSGLAYSSRNNRLNPAQKTLAEEFAMLFHQTKSSCATIKEELEHKGIKVEYIEEHFGRRFAAVYVDDVRLIDNYVL